MTRKASHRARPNAPRKTLLGDATSDLTATSVLPQDPNGQLLPGAPVTGNYADIRVPGYTLISVLGQGGMGVVFLARQERLGRFVAIKMISTEATHDASYLRRLEREAQTLATLSHPNIVGCHDILTTDQGTFLVMQFVPGQLSVRDLLLRFGRISEAVVARIACDTARGLDYAWKKGICHRDIKPDNLLIYREDPSPPHTPDEAFTSPNARVMICDFGIARDALAAGSADAAAGSVLGSPAYMAPEQAFDRSQVDFRADIYALGTSLYQLLTGKRPFHGPNGIETVRLKLDADLPDPRREGVAVSDECIHILRRMGAREPSRRYAAYEELLADLASWLSQQQQIRHRRVLGHFPPAFWKGLSAGAAVVLVAVVVITGDAIRRALQPPPPSRAASLVYWSGDRSSWRAGGADAETGGPTLLGLSPNAPLTLRQVLRPDVRVRFKVRIPGASKVRCALRQGSQDRWWLHWERSRGASSFASEADGREIPLVEIPDRRPLEWLSVDIRARTREIDLYIDGKLRAIAPLKEPLTEAYLVLEIPGGGLAQFTDVWVTEMP